MKSKCIFFAVIGLMFGLNLQAQQPTVVMDVTSFPTNGIDSITFHGAKFHAKITSNDSWTLSGKGFAISTNPGALPPYSARINGTPSGYAPIPFQYSAKTSNNALVPNTTYYVRAFVKKGSGASADTAWSDAVSFTTNQVVFPTLSMNQATNIELNTATISGKIDRINDPYKQFVGKGFVYSTTSNPVIGNSELITISGTNPNANNSNTPFALTKDLTNLVSGTLYYARIYIIVKFGAGDNDTLYSNQITFTTRHACGSVPYNLDATSDVGQTTALIKWNPELGQTKWQVDYGVVGHTPGNGDSLLTVTDTFVVADNLTPNMDYTAYVRAFCSDTVFSEWSVLTPESYFRTLPYTCAPIADVDTVQILNTSAIIRWTPGAQTQWRWEVMFAKNADSYPENGLVIMENPVFQPVGLLTNTAYKFKVRAICDKHDDVVDTLGDWSEEVVFITKVNDLESLSAEDNAINIYPNPTTGEINFEGKTADIAKIEINDCLGRTIAVLNKGTTSFAFDKTAKGIFVVKIYTEQGLQTKKIILE
jgi:hypothetical protein